MSTTTYSHGDDNNNNNNSDNRNAEAQSATGDCAHSNHKLREQHRQLIHETARLEADWIDMRAHD